jgi:RND family efflux transporter MFP subunit
MRTTALIGVVVLGLASVGMLAVSTRQLVTRPASAATSAPRAPRPSSVRADGRVVARPGAQVVVAAETPATIARIAAREGTRVKKGDVLVELRHAETSSARGEAWAASAEAAARLRAREADLKRAKALAATDSISRREVDTMAEERSVARARLAGAQATVARLSAVLDRAKIVAPIDGVVIERTAEVGETVAAGAPLFTIVDLDRLRIEAEIDEFDIARAVVGATVAIRSEGLPGESWKGAIEEIPDALVKRRIRPLDPSRPTDTAVLLAKVTMPDGTGLKLGQRVSLEIGEAPAETTASAR